MGKMTIKEADPEELIGNLDFSDDLTQSVRGKLKDTVQLKAFTDVFGNQPNIDEVKEADQNGHLRVLAKLPTMLPGF